MADIKKLLEQRQSKNSNKTYSGDIYPFWNMQLDQIAEVRLLPDANDENPLPFVEKLEHKLPINGQMKKVPCLKMFGKKCPICDLSQEYYSAEGEKSQNGKYYYRDRLHLAKAIVIKDPLPADPNTGETFEGKVVTLQLGYQLYERIMEQLASFFEDEDDVPWHPKKGFNFKIKKVKQGKWEKYDIGSTFAKNSSPIPKEYLENLELTDLSTLLPAEVSFDELNQMLEAHLSGGDIDEDSLESKKRKSSDLMNNEDDDEDDSTPRSALSRLTGNFDEDDEDEDEDDDAVTESSTSRDDEEEDDDDDDDEDLQALINRAKNRNK